MTDRLVTKAFTTALVKGLISRAEALREIKHPGIGPFREAFLDGLLRHFLTSQFGTGTGFVINSKGQKSRQVDIVIYDNRVMPPMLRGERGDVFPCEAVIATVEVKSSLDKTAFDGCKKNATSICEVESGSMLRPIFNETSQVGPVPPIPLVPPILKYVFSYALNGLAKLRSESDGVNLLENSRLHGLCAAGSFSWMLIQGKWTYRGPDERTCEEIKRFLGVALDNIRSIGELRYRMALQEHWDWLGAYIRDQD